MVLATTDVAPALQVQLPSLSLPSLSLPTLLQYTDGDSLHTCCTIAATCLYNSN